MMDRFPRLYTNVPNHVGYEDYVMKFNVMSNVIRYSTKSSTSTHVAKFNGIFINKGSIACPTIKHAVSTIDVGQSKYIVTDRIGAASSSIPVLQEGGTCFTSDVSAAMSLMLTKDQWNLWQRNRPSNVLERGDPGISSVISMFTGAVGTSMITYTLDQDVAMRYWVSAMMENSKLVDISDTTRTAGSVSAPMTGQSVRL